MPHLFPLRRNVTMLRYPVKMGRPREHDHNTAVALLNAAERIVDADGLHALSVRGLALEARTSTRAVYSLFGSKNGLVSALGARTFDLLGASLGALPTTQDAAADLVEAGVRGFRCLIVDHPGLFKLGIQQTHVTAEQAVEIRAAAARAWEVLVARVVRVEQQGRLGTRTITEAATAFHALCEGLAALEVRGALPRDTAESHWRNALTDLVGGFNASR